MMNHLNIRFEVEKVDILIMVFNNYDKVQKKTKIEKLST